MTSPHPAVFAWRGPSLLVTSPRGECGPAQPLSGFFHRETRFLSVLRFEVDGDALTPGAPVSIGGAGLPPVGLTQFW